MKCYDCGIEIKAEDERHAVMLGVFVCLKCAENRAKNGYCERTWPQYLKDLEQEKED